MEAGVPKKKSWAGLSGSTLKMIAVISMLIDHTAVVVLEKMMRSSEPWISDLYGYMRNIGRIAFPIFCFLLVEGFIHTRNVRQYALRLGIFALISEIPFDFAFFGKVLEFRHQNVFFTLCIGLITLIVFDLVEKGVWNYVLRIVLAAIVALSGIMTANYLMTDYGGGGIVCILVFYVFRKYRLVQTILGYASYVFFIRFQVWALPAFFLPLLYRGKRGFNLKYFFYVIYPAHLLILYGICYLMNLV